MAHFAKIEDGIVTEVCVIHNSVVDPEDSGSDNEQLGKDFIASLNLEGTWLQTSYNGNFRKQYAQIGFTYDSSADEFVSFKPIDYEGVECASWTLDSNNDWQPPVAKPTDEPAEAKSWVWDETSYQADNTQGWVQIP
tara:strand:- start:2212 stop:2622 length:411 start_codon:yes stop_codon:yes gene_type:complete